MMIYAINIISSDWNENNPERDFWFMIEVELVINEFNFTIMIDVIGVDRLNGILKDDYFFKKSVVFTDSYKETDIVKIITNHIKNIEGDYQKIRRELELNFRLLD